MLHFSCFAFTKANYCAVMSKSENTMLKHLKETHSDLARPFGIAFDGSLIINLNLTLSAKVL